MKQSLIITQGSPRLLLFFAGWGMDETPFMHYRPRTSDLMICYDYRRLNFDSEALASYAEIHLIAWSMGVWAASQVLQHADLRITRRIAINGTLYPIDADKGIPPDIFRGTLDGLCEATLHKFHRRMCKDADTYRCFQKHAPRRPCEELKDELYAIEQQSQQLPLSTNLWDQVFIGDNDRIFPPQAQHKAWEGVCDSIKHGNQAHYDNDLFLDCFQ